MSYTKQTWDTTSFVNPTRMNHIEDGIDNALPKDSGGTVNGDILVTGNVTAYNNVNSRGHVRADRQNGTTTQVGDSYVMIGNDTAAGTAKNSKGYLRLYSQGTKHIQLSTVSSVAENRNIALPDKNGTVALVQKPTSMAYSSIQSAVTSQQNASNYDGINDVLHLNWAIKVTTTSQPTILATFGDLPNALTNGKALILQRGTAIVYYATMNSNKQLVASSGLPQGEYLVIGDIF